MSRKRMKELLHNKLFKKLLIIFISFLLILIFLFIWEKFVEINNIPKRILIRPSEIWNYTSKEFTRFLNNESGTIFIKSLQSFRDALFGFGITIILGIILGYFFARFHKTKILFSPVLFVIQLLPVPAFAPVIASIWGYDMTTKIFIIVLFTLFPVIITVEKAIINTPHNYKSLLLSYNASELKTFLTLTLPSIIPDLFVTMKILCTSSFVASIIAELPLTINGGIGKDIYVSFSNQAISRVWSSLFIVAIISLVFYFAVSSLEKYISKNFKYGVFE